ncbi:DUF7286 family protein [Methanosarcina sp.]|uniref:DUF7286 family protein n=1 Tax=Methanosarcina sp. TaxID=2213 RepID=UPI003BB48E6F
MEAGYTAGKLSADFSYFCRDTAAYIPYAVIGIFIVLAATFTSVYLLKMDSEVAETIYTTGRSDPGQTAINLAESDLARCLNYAGMEALEWQGEHPVILPEGTPVERLSEDGFMAIPKNQNLERGDTLQIAINLPSDVWGKIESLWKDRDIKLIIKDSSGYEIKKDNYGQATGFFQKVSFEDYAKIPDSAASGYASIELYYGDELKASDWVMIEVSPVKDITADSFNRLISANYQGNSHTFMQYAVNVEPDIKPEQIKIRKIRGTLQREIFPANKNYTLYYVLDIPALNYTLVNLESGERFNSSMDLSTMVTSREPLLEELVREYETDLGNSSGLDSASNIVLGATNLRTFVYGPWQHYANGPLNILTNPALSSSINGATLYAQKRVFDSVDPLALTYTTYYNGKVFYEDVSSSSSKKTVSRKDSPGLNTSGSSYENDKGVNLTTTYDSLKQDRSFSLDVEEGIGDSLEEGNTSFKELSESSEITVAASDYTDGVLDGWALNDHLWAKENPDLIHTVTDNVYTASVQGQVVRDGFASPRSLDSKLMAELDSSSVSPEGHTVRWGADHFASGKHTGSLVPSYLWSSSVTNSYSKSLCPSIKPPKGKVVSWSLTGASVSLLSTDISDVRIEPQYSYASNDRLTVKDRSEGYLNQEDHVFDWEIRYDISYKINTKWKIAYSYDYTYRWKSREKLPDGNYTTVTNYDTASGSDSESDSKIDSESFSHYKTESENLSVIYHRRPPTGEYRGISSYSGPSIREYRETNVYVNGTERFDPCCSDAADKYRDKHVDFREIEGNFWAYPDGKYLGQHAVGCDVPPWLHRVMAEEVLSMLGSVEKDNPTFKYSLVASPGRDPTDLQVEASTKLARKLESSRNAYVNKNQHLNPAGKIYTSSDSARYIAKNEAYNRLLKDIEQKNSNLDSDLNSYILDSLEKKGLDTGLLDSVTSGPMTLFNNPAIKRASSVLGKDMGIISTMTVTGQPESKYNWTENLTLIVDQKPNYLYHDPDFDLRGEYEWADSMTGKTIYPLGVRNTCIFTTGISEEIADALASSNEYVKTETAHQLSQSISTLDSEFFLLKQNLREQGVFLDITPLNREFNRIKHTYVLTLMVQVNNEVVSEVKSNPVVSGWISEETLRDIISGYFISLSADQLIQKTTTDELASELAAIIKTEIRNSNPPVEPDELEAALSRVDTDVRIGVANGICAVTTTRGEALDTGFVRFDNELKNLETEISSKYSDKTAARVSKKLDKTMVAVPSGLPVLPPHWIFTVNVWTYEIKGEYETFSVNDNDNEVIPEPYFGHKGQKYIRKYEHISHPCKKNPDGSSIWLGENARIRFQISGYASSIVGSGPKGVGDKEGGYSEKSVGFDELSTRFGG